MSTALVPPEDRSARWSVSAIFLVNGTVFSSWVPHIPLVQERLGLSEGGLGLALLGMALGAIVAMPLSGWLIGHIGSRRIVAVSTVAFCLALPLPVLAPSPVALVAALVLFGVCNGGMDVAMNAQAVAVETAYGKPIMSSFHGLFSVGGLVGAGLGGMALAAEWVPRDHVLLVTLCAALVGLLALRGLRTEDRDASDRSPTFVRPTGPLVGLGLLAFLVLMAEGAMADWSAVYLRNALATGPGLAAAGYAAFSLAMAVGRLTGDRFVARFGSVALARGSALLAAISLGTALLVGHPLAAIVGFGCLGLGLSNLIPLLFSAAGRTPGTSTGTGIAAVATLGYFGLLAGPPLIGFAAELITLPGALGLLVLGVLAVAGFAHLTRRAAAHRTRREVGREQKPFQEPDHIKS